ncbi:MAG: hypothetical protein V4709_00275 [Pseudomonadota bacterium]
MKTHTDGAITFDASEAPAIKELLRRSHLDSLDAAGLDDETGDCILSIAHDVAQFERARAIVAETTA